MLGPAGLDMRTDAATEAVETMMYRALAVLRVVVLVNAVVVSVFRWDELG